MIIRLLPKIEDDINYVKFVQKEEPLLKNKMKSNENPMRFKAVPRLL